MAENDNTSGKTTYSGSGRKTFTTGEVWKDFFDSRTGVNAEEDSNPNTGSNG